MLRRRRTAVPAVEAGPGLQQLERRPAPGDFPAIERIVPAQEETGAWLELPDGQRHNLTNQPATLGFTPDCNVFLENTEGGERLERVRIWLREGNYMLHNLSRLGAVYVEGRPVTWVILEDGDQVIVGPAALVFHWPRGGTPEAAAPPTP
jgi:hypothetical protein